MPPSHPPKMLPCEPQGSPSRWDIQKASPTATRKTVGATQRSFSYPTPFKPRLIKGASSFHQQSNPFVFPEKEGSTSKNGIFHLESKPNCILFCIFLSPKLYFRHLFVNYSYIQWACVYVSQRKEYLRRPYPWVSPNSVLLSSQEYNCTKNGENAEMLKGWGPVEK